MLTIPTEKYMGITGFSRVTTEKTRVNLAALLTAIFPDFVKPATEYGTYWFDDVCFELTYASSGYIGSSNSQCNGLKLKIRDSEYHTVWRKIAVVNNTIDETKVKEKFNELKAMHTQFEKERVSRNEAAQAKTQFIDSVRSEVDSLYSSCISQFDITSCYGETVNLSVGNLTKDQLKQVMALVKSFEKV